MVKSAQKTISEKDKAAIHKADDLVEDPHCHTYIPKSSAYVVSINGKSVYFCSERCLREYMREKEKISKTQEDI
jgi:YHS domain-containing protein